MKSLWKISTISALTIGSFSIALSALAGEEYTSIADIISNSKDGEEVHLRGKVIEKQEGEDEYLISDETGEIAVEVEDLDIELNAGTEIDVLGVVSLELENEEKSEKEADPTPEEIEIEATEVNIIEE